MNALSATDKLTKAKTLMVFHHPFFAIVAMRLPLVENTNISTMATDMSRIYYNPAFVDTMTVDECAAVIMHEVLHVAWMHGLRRGTRDPLIWNLAGDFAINLVVQDTGMKLPLMGGTKEKPNFLYDEKYRNWSATSIYEDLIKDAEKWQKSYKLNGKPDGSDKGDQDSGGGGGQGDGQDKRQVLIGEVLDAAGADGKELSQAEKASLEEEIKIAVTAAAERAKSIGKLPGALAGLIEAVGKPKVNWKDYIQEWVSGRVPDNYTWQRPNRSMMANFGIYMPRMQLNGAGVGVLSIDTSGSVSDKELRDYVREIAGVIELCNPEKLYIIQHDAVIQDIYEWESGEDFTSLKIKGRGGTCIQPSFTKALEFDEQIDWMICFTDMEICDWPKEAPPFPVLWCATGNETNPFGTYIDIRDHL